MTKFPVSGFDNNKSFHEKYGFGKQICFMKIYCFTQSAPQDKNHINQKTKKNHSPFE
jgi:hypothetical protein